MVVAWAAPTWVLPVLSIMGCVSLLAMKHGFCRKGFGTLCCTAVMPTTFLALALKAALMISGMMPVGMWDPDNGLRVIILWVLVVMWALAWRSILLCVILTISTVSCGSYAHVPDTDAELDESHKLL